MLDTWPIVAERLLPGGRAEAEHVFEILQSEKRNLDLGLIDLAELARRISTNLDVEVSTQHFRRLVLGPGLVTIPANVAFAESLSNRTTIRTIAVSNVGPEIAAEVQARFHLYSTFSAAVLSYQIAAVKPDPAFYNRALQVGGIPPQECLFLDDDMSNVLGARSAGMISDLIPSPSYLRRVLIDRGITASQSRSKSGRVRKMLKGRSSR